MTDVARADSSDLIQTLARNHARFLAFLERRTGSREAAEDLLQDAFVRGLERGHTIRDEESAVAWFYRVLRNALTDHYRRHGVERRALERIAQEPEYADPELDAELMAAACECIGGLLGALKPEYAAAVEAVDLGGATVREYADQAGISSNNASVRLHRAHQALRRLVSESCRTCAVHECLDCTCGNRGSAA